MGRNTCITMRTTTTNDRSTRISEQHTTRTGTLFDDQSRHHLHTFHATWYRGILPTLPTLVPQAKTRRDPDPHQWTRTADHRKRGTLPSIQPFSNSPGSTQPISCRRRRRHRSPRPYARARRRVARSCPTALWVLWAPEHAARRYDWMVYTRTGRCLRVDWIDARQYKRKEQ